MDRTGARPSTGAGRVLTLHPVVMPRNATELAIAAWHLRGSRRVGASALPPETFLEEAAQSGRLFDAGGEADVWQAIEAHGASRARCSAPPPSVTDIAELGRLGAPGGPCVDAAVALLRRARRTRLELEALATALASQVHGPLQEAVRIECAYLLVRRGETERALEVLSTGCAPTWAPAAARHAPGRALTHETLARLAREARFLWKHRAYFDPAGAYVPPPLPLEAPVADVSDPSLFELDLSGITLDELRCLGRIGAPGGPSVDEAMALLRRVRGTADELHALDMVLASRTYGPLPEAVRLDCADRLAARGERARALRLLEHAGAPEGAQGLDDGAAREGPKLDEEEVDEGNADSAARRAEQALAADVDALGIKERHARWRAVGRAGRLTMEAFRTLAGRSKRAELRDAARALESAGDAARAAEVFALASDYGASARLGAVARREVASKAGPDADRIDALDRSGQRLVALAAARAWLAEHPEAWQVAALARAVTARLLRGPLVDIEIDGEARRYALGDEVTIGRADASIIAASPAVSRQHVRLRRMGGKPIVEDLGSHNGTWIAGAKMVGPMPVGTGVQLDLAGQVPCVIRPLDGGLIEGELLVEVAGERVRVPLGEARLGPFRVERRMAGGEPVVVLRATDGGELLLNEANAEGPIELCVGDVIGSAATPAGELRVIGG